ncbi:uncharacterized protein METZ01_LOCUS331906, partial [marine metagenome]
MHEGIAKYFETKWRNGNGYLTPVMETILARGLKANYLIPLDRMMPSLAKLETAEDVQLAYAEVSTMIEYLTQTQGNKVISSILEKLAEGESFNHVLIEKLEIDLNAFQKEWRQFITQKKLKAIPGFKLPGIKFKTNRLPQRENKEYEEIDNHKSQDLVFLGDILKSRGFHKAAIIEYQSAIDQSEFFSPILYNKLAKTHFITKEHMKAKVLLEKNLAYYPMFHTTLANLGELYFDTGNIKKSLKFYERSIRVNPFNPFVHIRLMTIYQKMGQKNKNELQAKL